jgi:hypothetical protein
MTKLKRKILVLVLVVWLNLFQPVVVLSQEIPTETLAEETIVAETPASTPTSQPENQPTETPAPEDTTVIPTPVPTGEASIDTGNVLGASGNDLEINNIGLTVPGEVGSCNLEIGCSNVNNDNTADIGTSTSVESDSGNNEIGATVSMSTINTGDALGLIDGSNTINQNQIILIVETPASTPVTDSTIVNQNQAAVDNADIGNANSGNNQNTNDGGSGTTNTGDVMVVANMVNQVNVNQIGSNIKIYIINNPSQDKQDLDLNAVWRELMSFQTSALSVVDVTNQLIANQNQGSISNLMLLNGNSGNNMMTVNENGQITTGNVTVLANLINLLNINLIGSRIFLGVINLRGETLGNIILPNPEMFVQMADNQNGGKDATFQWINEATIKQEVDLASNSGGNSIDASQNGIITSGNSTALVNSDTYANINSTGSNWFAFKINLLGNWEGQVINWGSPGAMVAGEPDQYSLAPLIYGNSGQGGGTLVSINQNYASIYNRLSLSANSGYNTLLGNNAEINSGNTTAIANIFNLANLNVWGSNWFWGTITILGDWKGNAIFAYPDLTVGISSADSRIKKGETIRYDLNYSNIGYDVARVGRIEMDIPEGVWYENDSSDLPKEIAGNKIIWELHDVEPKAGGNFSVWFKTEGPPKQAMRKFWEVKKAYATEDEEQLTVKAKISTTQSESSLNNNLSTAATIVWFDSVETEQTQGNESGQNGDNQLPQWLISAKNNVNNFVYPGDVVTFEVEAKNVGEGTAYDSYLLHQIYDEKDNLLRTDTINLGEVEINRGGKVSFGIRMPTKFVKTSNLKSTTLVVGKSKNSQEVRSSKAITTFKVKVRWVDTAAAKEEPEKQILGTNTGEFCLPRENILPYLLLFVVSGFWLNRQTRAWLKEIKRKSAKN